MKRTYLLHAAAALVLSVAPALAQGHEQHGQAQGGEHANMDMTQMICAMGMLPHGPMGAQMGGMGQKMGGMGMMGGMMGGQKQGGAMQHGQQPPAQAGAAQHAQHGAQAAAKQEGHEGGMSHPVTPTMLIHHANDLGLSQDQISKVSELLVKSTNDCKSHLEAATHAHHQAAQLLGGPTATPDVAAYQGKLQEAITHVLQGHVAVVKAGVEAKKLLTPAQLEKLGKHE